MNKDIKISVIIATYNGHNYIKQAIDSVLVQTFKDFEIIVVDDGSTDAKMKEVLSPYILDNSIKYIYRENGGPGAARNSGVEVSTGKYLAFLDDDDYWENSKLQKQFDLIEKDFKNVVCYTDSWIIDPEDNIKRGTRKEIYGEFYEGKVIGKIIFNNFVTLSSSLVRRDIFTKVGMFTDSKYKLFMIEDYDLWLKMCIKGNFCFVDEPLVYYRTRLPLSRDQKCFEYRKLLRLFWIHFMTSDFRYKIYYLIGGTFYFIKYSYHIIFNFIHKFKNNI